MSQKRNRSVNWEADEKKLLRSVVKDHTNILENKSMDTITNKAKAKAWNEILKKFNETNSRTRALSQLQIQWRAMKINAKNRTGSKKKEIIAELMNQVDPLTDSSTYDSDGFLPTQGTVEPAIQIMEMSKQFPGYNMYETDVKEDKDISHNNSNMMNTQKQTPAKKKECMYTREIITHSKYLKDAEHKRVMERADEEHLCRMEINAINLKKAKIELKCAEIELEILELRKAKEKFSI